MRKPNRPNPDALTILQVIPELETGGAERSTIDIAKALVASGGKAIIATRGGRLARELEATGAFLARMPVHSKNPATMALNVRRLRKLIRRHNVDIVHARSRAPAWSALAAARAERVPFITTYHGTYNGKTFFKRFYNSSMVRGDKVIANSQFIADIIANEHPKARERVCVIHRGTDIETFSLSNVSEERKAALAQAWNISDRQKPLILLPGRLTRWKGQLVFLNALAILMERGVTDFIAVLAGDAQGRDNYVSELWRAIDEHGLRAQVRLVGHCEDMPAACALADMVVSPAIEPEAFGRIAIEAQAMERPVIVADHGGACETIIADDHKRTGWRVTPNDPEALADAMKTVLSLSPEDRADLQARARTQSRRFSLSVMCDRTLDLYREVKNDTNRDR